MGGMAERKKARGRRLVFVNGRVADGNAIYLENFSTDAAYNSVPRAPL